MDELDQILATVPPARREAVRSYWVSSREAGFSPQELTQAIRQKYQQPQVPVGPGAMPSVAVDRTASFTPHRQQAVSELQNAPGNTVGVEHPQGLPRPQIGPIRAAIRSAGHAGTFGFGDEISAALRTGKTSGPEYEAVRSREEADVHLGQSLYPTATTAGAIAGGVLPALAAPEALPARLGLRAGGAALIRGGTLGGIARNVGEGAVLGAASGAGNASPGHRILGAAEGSVIGGTAAGVLGTAGAAIGSRMGAPAGRVVRDIAEAGDVDISQAANRLAQADPESPLIAADLLGPTATQRLRGIRDITGPGQRTVVEGLESRGAGRPMRVQSTFEDALGTSGLNPVQAAADLRAARGTEAQRLFGLAYQESPSAEAVEVARIPLVRDQVTRLREMRRNAGESVPKGKATVEELHTVRMILDKQSQALDNPSAASADKAPALIARGLRDRVDAALKSSPAFRQADEAFTEGSRFMERYESGTRALQTDPSELEYLWQHASPDERQLIRLGLPASTLKAIEGGSARGALSRIGFGPTGRIGRGRVLEDILPPAVGARIGRVVGDEDVMARTEQGVLSGSATSTNQEGIRDALASGSLRGALRRRLVQSVMGTPSPEALSQQADVLMTGGHNRGALADLLAGAVDANQKRAGVRSATRRGSRLSALLLPTFADSPE